MTTTRPRLLPLAGGDARARAERKALGYLVWGTSKKMHLEKMLAALKDPASQLPESEPQFVGFPSPNSLSFPHPFLYSPHPPTRKDNCLVSRLGSVARR